MQINELTKLAKELRIDILTTLNKAGAGHSGGSLSEIDLLPTALYFGDILNTNPKNPKDENRDRFILSKGHASPGLYVVLAKKGFFPKKELDSFRQINSLLQGHTDIRVPGIEMSSGSLGMGLSFANGIALAARLDKKSYKTFVLMGDGEMQEGQVWEAAMNTAFHKLSNVVLIIDKNGIQNDDFVKNTAQIDPLTDKWKSFGWDVVEINGHDMKEIVEALKKAMKHSGKPLAIIASTVKGKGVSFMENNPEWHGKAPNDEQLDKALIELK